MYRFSNDTQETDLVDNMFKKCSKE